ncbi:hypothetical protein BDN72DRAFT_755228 [Pluteus cervinus]|uniref:Uncharacterized protein n=1 Tax=Pluteus cervinus TaxID=181527 RepID=A0ACD3BGC5_9AGAR|nr:hypothetical protein BDN72DRAFT_755228 [Pluteus cervinus]
MSAREDTPLLRKALSFSTPFDPTKRPRLPTPVSSPTLPQINEPRPIVPPSVPPALRRRQSAVSTKSVTYHYGGKSTFGQTLFNSIAILLGIGMLSEPLAFAYAGWGAGTLLIISYGFISCYTAKILARIILSDPRLRSYSDIGRKAFGPRSTVFISIMFCLELFAVSVILVTLYADSLHSIIPEYSSDAYKVCGLALLIPTVFLPLSLLSYTSILGIISTMFIVVVIVIDGFNKKEAPGSFWEPAETSFGIASMNKLGIAFGLFMAGFSGHAVIPSLARDMKDPSQFDRMINWAFVIATLVYTLIGWAGYAMFGSSVSEEISMDLLSTPGYDPNLNLAALWMLVISPLSKFALTTQPLNATLEILLGVDSLSSTTDARKSLDGCKPGGCFKQVVSTIQRLCMTILAVAVSICVPQFSAMMAFLGSFSAFLLCVIGPITAKIALEGRCNRFDGFVLIIASIMAGWGTYAAFIAAEE